MDFEKEALEKLLDSLQDGIYLINRDKQITFWNRGAERLTGYTKAEVQGSGCWQDILVHVAENGLSLCETTGCPALETLRTGETNETERAYLHHKQGYRVPVTIRTSALRNATGQVIGAAEIFSERLSREATERELEQLRTLALLDPVTGIANRRYGDVQIQKCLDQHRRYQWPFGLLFIDLDHFKDINDTHGHEVGDRVLNMVAQTLEKSTRSFDHVARWGGEEFVAILANVDRATLKTVAENLRALVQKSFLEIEGNRISVTISIGGSMCRQDDTHETLLRRVDSLMYASKENGRNRVTIG
jgi:diguanylate cyclase (GGDEF)-like protein/PAS domain S-box-containing protein